MNNRQNNLPVQQENNNINLQNLHNNPSEFSNCIDSYYTYSKIVGNDDNGKPFTPKQLQFYIQKIAKFRNENRIYCYWVNPDGLECKSIGPETKCLCGCLFKDHRVDQKNANQKVDQKLKVDCKKCKNGNCSNFFYVPGHGTTYVRCGGCKRATDDHKNPGNKSSNPSCTGFYSNWNCDCGISAKFHKTIFQNRLTRSHYNKRTDFGEPNGLPHDPFLNEDNRPISNLYKGLGGLTGHCSLMSETEEGHVRAGMSAIEFEYRSLE